MKTITAIIVEDEQLASELLLEFLKDFSSIEIVGTYSDGFSATQAINKYRPDVLFLDIKIPKITGIELLELLDYNPLVVFTTAYDEYAIKAFEIHAVDYLLKPFSRERFGEAVSRILYKMESKSGTPDRVNHELIKPGELLSRIVVKSGSTIHILPVSDILYLEAQDDYVMIHTEEKRFLKQKTMKYYEDHLDRSEFVRVHRSFIVAVSTIAQLEQYEKEAYRLHIHGGKFIPVSKTGYKILKEVLKF